MARLRLLSVAACLLLATSTLAGPPPAANEPLLVDGQLEYPEGVAVPRSLTSMERRYQAGHPRALPKGTPSPPVGPIHCPAEYEPMDGILVSYEGADSWKNILTQMGVYVTTIGDGNYYVTVDTTTEEADVLAQLDAAGADMTRVRSLVHRTDTIWMRDYGPRYIYEGGVRAIVDHTYNRPRPRDNSQPSGFAPFMGHAIFELPLIHGGGNFHLDANDNGFATRLINNENPGLTQEEIHGLWFDYQNLDTTFLDAFPVSVDATQHLDMWMIVIADDAVIISDWPMDEGSTQDVICDQTAVDMAARGYTVHRIPARSVRGTHYTYTNMVLCNDLAMIPSYAERDVVQHNDEALAVWEAAVPGKTVVQIPSQDIVTAAGVLHCTVMHVPAHLGGENPTVYMRNLRGCEHLIPGESVLLDWLSDDDVGVSEVEVHLSIDGGRTFPFPVAVGLSRTERFTWVVPPIETPRARLRVTVRDADGNEGTDVSDQNFQIGFPDPIVDLSLPLLVEKTRLTAELSIPESPHATAYSLYEGEIGDFTGIELMDCLRDTDDPDLRVVDGLMELSLPMPEGDRWYLVSASNCLGESTLDRPWLGPARCGSVP